MGAFATYFGIGFEHIAGLAGFDHILFVLVLCAVYERRAWRRVLAVLTGFTLGHSLTLALTALGILAFPSRVIELLIPLTILITSILNIRRPEEPRQAWRQATLAAGFGLIHGCGFAGYFSMMLGDEQSITGPLFAFNLGLEAGQIVVVAVFYGIYFMLEKWLNIASRDRVLVLCGAGGGLALKLILDGLFAV